LGAPGTTVAAGAPAEVPIEALCAELAAYLDADQIREVRRAYELAAEAHAGQRRLSGEPYIHHPVEVARILAGMRLDQCSIMAALLHDVIEDTGIGKEQLAYLFGDEVAELVDGVKRRRIARETLEIYAPIANRLGMNSLRIELEDLGFAALHPLRHRVLREAVRRARGNRKEIVARIETALKRRLRQEGLAGRVVGREKHLYSIYQKMRSKGVSFSEIMDVYAFRIVVDSVDTCYRVLGAVHNLYKPVPGRFKDYIAIPKANGYQSLHTTLFGPYGVPIEIQIRTEEMDHVAEQGVAAHWLYKTGDKRGASAHARAREWLRDLLEMQKSAGDSLEFLENVKIDLFPDEVYVFTPAGDIMELPRGATAVDFAYAVHTDIGNTCVACRIDRRLMPLSTRLLNGQTVEIITAPGARPNPAWLDFVVTGKARANIRHYLKNLRRSEAIHLGRRLLDRALGAWGTSLADLPRGGGQRRPARHPRHRGHGGELRALLPAHPGRRHPRIRVRRPGRGHPPPRLQEPGRVPQAPRALGGGAVGRARGGRVRRGDTSRRGQPARRAGHHRLGDRRDGLEHRERRHGGSPRRSASCSWCATAGTWRASSAAYAASSS